VTVSPEELASFWNRSFRRLDGCLPPVRSERIEPILRRLREQKVSAVLDIGSGYGRWSIPLAREGFTVTAVDISEEAINLLNTWTSQQGLRVTTAVGTAQQLTLSDQQFDAILCVSVLDHMTHADAVLSAAHIRRLLRVGGIAFVTFDGLDESEVDDFELLADGSRVYTSGSRKGMLWRFFSDDEIRTLVEDFEPSQFEVRENGNREFWLRKTTF